MPLEVKKYNTTEVRTYEKAYEFREIMHEKCKDRIFTFLQEGPRLAFLTNTFMDRNRIIHKLELEICIPKRRQVRSQFIEEEEGFLVPQLEGRIEVAPETGHIYQILEASYQKSKKNREESYLEWIEAASYLEPKGTTIGYARIQKNKKQIVTILDAIRDKGRIHLVTMLNEDLSIGNALDYLADYEVNNHTPELKKKNRNSYASKWLQEIRKVYFC